MSYVLFLMIGLGAGAVYALLGLGLVLKHRSAGVVDFSHAAVAMWCAYVFLELHTNGQLVFPWVAVATHIQLFSATAARPCGVSIVVALVYSAILGLIFYYAVVRPLRHAPVLARVCASRGLHALPGDRGDDQLRDLLAGLAADPARHLDAPWRAA